MWYNKFEIGDTIRYNINVNYKKTGETQDFILTNEDLNHIKKYEDDTNFHNMRIIKKYNIK